MNRVTSQKDRKLLYCIAAEGIAQNLTSCAMMKKYGLDNASSVQHSLSNLTGEKMPMARKLSKQAYMLQDRLLELWLLQRAGGLDAKFQNPEDRFERERSLTASAGLE